MFRKSTLLAGLGALGLVACNQLDHTPPQVSIASPANSAPVTGTASVQLTATDDTQVAKVSVYVRAAGTTGRGTLVGSATSTPYVVSLYTLSYPNASALELVPVATDTSGNETQGDATLVKVQNAGAPTLSYLAGFNLPPNPNTGVTTTGVQAASRPLATIQVEQVRRPDGAVTAPSMTPARSLRPLSTTTRTLAIEWGWPTVPGADGYGIYLTTSDASGPYVNQRYQAAATSGNQKFSRTLTAAELGLPLIGTITTRTQGNTVESGLSNADGATFMTAEQQVASPADGQVVADGRPILTWAANPQAIGYLYYVLDKNPFDPTAKIVWTNAPQSTDKLTAVYPTTSPALPSGTYFWWVGGVSFDARGQADAFSFSVPRSFVVP